MTMTAILNLLINALIYLGLSSLCSSKSPKICLQIIVSISAWVANKLFLGHPAICLISRLHSYLCANVLQKLKESICIKSAAPQFKLLQVLKVTAIF